MQEPYRKGSSESILASSLARDIVRCLVKRRQRYRWAGLLSFEKSQIRMPTPWCVGGRQYGSRVISRAAVRSCVVGEPVHADKTTCTRTGRSPARLGLTIKAGP